VAHVYAKDLEGVFFGYGYAQMQSHGNLVLKLYGESRGRAAEYWGEKNDTPALFGSGSNLDNDRWVWLNDAPARADRWLAQQSPEFQRYFAAFADGMNAYAERHPDALDAARKKVLPIRPVDALLHVHRIVHFGYLSTLRGVEAAVKALPVAKAAKNQQGESNAWAIAPARSASGKALLLMNPHLPWGDWSTYYEAHLIAPGINLYGSSQVGFPMLRFVFSEFLGFTQTVNSIDASDLYRLTLSPDGQGYLFDGAVKPFEKSTRTLKVLQADGSLREETLAVRRSIHGPVVWDQGGVTVAIRTAGLDRPFMIEQYWKMALAHTFAEYEAQLQRLQVPTFNITYADRDGHIMYLYNGTLPKRASGDGKFSGRHRAGRHVQDALDGHPPVRRSAQGDRSRRPAGCRTPTTRRGPRLIRPRSIPRTSHLTSRTPRCPSAP
jgi:acyl-homoserine-lactone acylase